MYNDYDSFDAFDRPQRSRKQKALPITYDDDDLFVASPRNQQYADPIIGHLDLSAHPGLSAVPMEHYSVSLVTAFFRIYWIRHKRTHKIFCYCKTNLVPDAFCRVLKYLHTTHKDKLYHRDQRHSNL